MSFVINITRTRNKEMLEERRRHIPSAHAVTRWDLIVYLMGDYGHCLGTVRDKDGGKVGWMFAQCADRENASCEAVIYTTVEVL
jgi:hypothetical protein